MLRGWRWVGVEDCFAGVGLLGAGVAVLVLYWRAVLVLYLSLLLLHSLICLPWLLALVALPLRQPSPQLLLILLHKVLRVSGRFAPVNSRHNLPVQILNSRAPCHILMAMVADISREGLQIPEQLFETVCCCHAAVGVAVCGCCEHG